VLASDAIERLAASGHLVAGSTVDVVRSEVVAAVRTTMPRPDLHDEESLRHSVLAARRIGYSTGPSGTQLLKLFERWGLLGQLEGRLVQAAPGVPVGSMVASGDVDLGFQQRSELMGVAGLEIVGPLPPPVQIVTVFSAAIATASRRAPEARAFLEFLAAPATAAAKARHGMAPA
jgi:molybdate transport system substrate-binding protein